MKARYLILFFIFSMVHALKSEECKGVNYSVDQGNVLKLSEAIKDERFSVICAYKTDDLMKMPTLKNGDNQYSIFLDGESYSSILGRINIGGVIDVYRGIKGDFDNFIFYDKFITGSSEGRETLRPVPGSKWILVLKKTHNKEGHLLPEYLIKYPQVDQIKILRPDTFFIIPDKDKGAMCVGWPDKWPEEYRGVPALGDRPKARFPIYTESLVDDLVEINRAYEGAVKESYPKKTVENIKAVLGKLKDATGVAVAKNVFSQWLSEEEMVQALPEEARKVIAVPRSLSDLGQGFHLKQNYFNFFHDPLDFLGFFVL